MYYINWDIKPKVMMFKDAGNQHITISVPTVLKSKSAGTNFNPNKIVYLLYLINLGNN
jgi:hypothetical protein